MPYPSTALFPSESVFPSATATETTTRIAVTREYPSDKLALRITPPNGAPSRWAADESRVENVIDGLKYSGELQGGEKELAGTLARNPRQQFPDLAAFSGAEVYGPGAETVWGEGRMDKAPESDGDHMSIDPAIVGHKAALEDDKAVLFGGIDGDLGKWRDPSAQRRLNLLAAEALLSGSSEVGWQGDGTQGPGIYQKLEEIGGKVRVVESWFDGGGVTLGKLLYYAEQKSIGIAANWRRIGGLVDSETSASTDGDYHNHEAANELWQIDATTATRRFARLYFSRVETATSESQNVWEGRWLQPKVIGDHGLTLQGTWPDVGFTAKQMLAYAIPLHSYLEVDEDDLEDSDFVIPQAWFSDPTTLLAIIEELTKYDVLDWFVRGRKFHLRFPGTYGRRWQLYSGPSGLKEQGLDASRLWRSIVVKYSDVDGTTRTVGPPGSGAMVEDAGLEITDPDHPAVRAELTRQDVLDLGGIGTQAQAIATGERWLEEANLLSRSGSCVASYYAMDDRGIFRPVSRIKEGDLVRFPDAHDTSWRRVVAYEYSHATRSNSLTLDAPKDSIPALLERYGAKLASLGIS